LVEAWWRISKWANQQITLYVSRITFDV